MEPGHKELLIGLIGSTYGELKRLDDSIVGSSSTLVRRSEEAKRELANVMKGALPKQDVPLLQAIAQPQPIPPQAVPTNLPVQPFIPPQPQVVYSPPVMVNQNIEQPQPVSKPDDGQLEFDLNKVAKYDDVINEINRIETKLNKVLDILESINNKLPGPKKNRGTVAS